MWRALRTEDSVTARESLFSYYLPFGRVMAAKLYARRATNEVEFDDFMQLASVGLLEAIDRYRLDLGASFKTYAASRIQGSILTGIEKFSDSIQQAALRGRVKKERLESLHNDMEPTPDTDLFAEMAEVAIGLALGYVLEGSGMYADAEPSYPDNAYSRCEMKQLAQRVRTVVENLPERERAIITLHYYEHVPFHEIAERMSITKGRVSQIHARAMRLLKEVCATLTGLNVSI